jgi:hypothetical protein
LYRSISRAIRSGKVISSNQDVHAPTFLILTPSFPLFSRLLSGDGIIFDTYPGMLQGNGTLEQWNSFARTETETNNYALTRLVGRPCCQGVNTDPKYLEEAKDLLKRFTFVLDIECLEAGLVALADILGITPVRNRKRKVHPPPEDRIPSEVHKFLLQRNRLDIALYKWTKTISLVDCSAL